MDELENKELFKGLSESLQKQLEDVFADKVASSALEMFSEEDLKQYAKDMFFKLNWNCSKTRYWREDTDALSAKVYNKFTEKVGKALENLVEEGLFDQEAKETAERIYEEAMESAERYLVEAMANHMALLYTDFNNNAHKMDMQVFVNDVMSKHMSSNHMPR